MRLAGIEKGGYYVRLEAVGVSADRRLKLRCVRPDTTGLPSKSWQPFWQAGDTSMNLFEAQRECRQSGAP